MGNGVEVGRRVGTRHEDGWGERGYGTEAEYLHAAEDSRYQTRDCFESERGRT